MNSKLIGTGYIFTPHWIDVLEVLNETTPTGGSVVFKESLDMNKYFNVINANGAFFNIYYNLERSELMRIAMKDFFKDHTRIKNSENRWYGNYSNISLLQMMTFDDFKEFVNNYYSHLTSRKMIIQGYTKRRRDVMGEDWNTVDRAK